MKKLCAAFLALAFLSGPASCGDPFDVGDKCPAGQHYEWRTLDVDGTPVDVPVCVDD